MSTKVLSKITTTNGLVQSGTTVDSSADGQALIRDAGALLFRALTRGDISLSASPRLVGRSTAGAGIAEELSIGTGLSLSAGVLAALQSSEGVWNFATSTTMADPGSGKFRINNALFTATTAIAFSQLTSGGFDFTQTFKALQTGDTIILYDKVATANQARYTVSGAVANNTTWFQIPVTFVSGAGTAPGNNNDVRVVFGQGGGGGGGFTDPTTTKGDLIARGASAPATRLAVGSDTQVLTADSTQALGVKWATPATSTVHNGICDGRLTLSSTEPVPTTTISAATTLYFLPYVGNRIALYDGTNWNLRTFTSLSLAVSGLTANMPVDIFCYDNAGTPTLEYGAAWNTGTGGGTGARGTGAAIVRQDGVWCKSGALTRRYLGTILGGAAVTDSGQYRYVWNMYNRVRRPLAVTEATATWSWNGTWHAANAQPGNRVETVIGLSEDPVYLQVHARCATSTNAELGVGVGVDTTTASAATIYGGYSTTNFQQAVAAVYRGHPGLGWHALYWVEQGYAGVTCTWVGVVSPTFQAGLAGEVWA